MTPAPIILFAFNRPRHLYRVATALAANTLAADSDLYIFCDGPRNLQDEESVEAVRKVSARIHGFKTVNTVFRTTNMGLVRSVITSISEILEKHDRVIVFEDDILSSPHTLLYLNTCLEKYACHQAVFNISAWSLPPNLLTIPNDYPWSIYCFERFFGWGWAIWKDRWESIDWEVKAYEEYQKNPHMQHAHAAGGADLPRMLHQQMHGRLKTWDIQVDFSRFCQHKVGISPVRSFTANIGMDGTGFHSTATNRFHNDISLATDTFALPDQIFISPQIAHYCRQAHS